MLVNTLKAMQTSQSTATVPVNEKTVEKEGSAALLRLLLNRINLQEWKFNKS